LGWLGEMRGRPLLKYRLGSEMAKDGTAEANPVEREVAKEPSIFDRLLSPFKREGWNRRTFLGISLSTLPAVAWGRVDLGRIRAAALGGAGATKVAVVLRVNGEEKRAELDARVTLLEALRDELALTGTKEGCGHGQCGACTVLVDGKRVLSCLTLAAAASGRPITTIEGLAKDGQLHPVQAAFLKHDGFQCGYCTPGQIISAVGLLAEGCPSEPEAIRECMSGNICRCGAYPNIIDAIVEARDAGKGRGPA
jgi:xanthine dehydrogenase YagT iron-sulfur-binding subunit